MDKVPFQMRGQRAADAGRWAADADPGKCCLWGVKLTGGEIMKRYAVATAVLIASLANAQNSINEDLRDELLEMGRRDQEVREALVPLLFEQTEQTSGEPNERFIAVVEEQNAVDEENFRRLEEIVKEHGWPGISLVGAEAGNVARMLIQHNTLERQKEYLPILKAAAEEGEVEAWGIAMLEDRIRVREGRNQLYGSNIEPGPEGECAVTPIDDPETVDERRQAVGLPPMDEYLRQIEENVGVRCTIASDETE